MMLEHLDALIGFAVVMLGVSLLVTILTQLGATLLGLRGTNLRWGIVQLLQTVHPQFADRAEEITDKILRHPLISDSAFSKVATRFPLMRRWQLASTIRLQELIGILEKLSGSASSLPPGTPPPPDCKLETVMATIAQEAKTSVGPELQALTVQVQELARAVGVTIPPPSMPASATTPLVRIEELLKKLPEAAEASLRDLKSWFEPAMDRTAQRFALHMRLWTVTFSILAAFALHLDAFRLLTGLSSNAELRASLAASSDALIRKASESLPARVDVTAGQLHVPQVYTIAMTQLGVSGAPDFVSREQGIEWLRKARGSDAGVEKLVAQYQQKVDEMLRGDAERLVDDANSVKALLLETKFQLVPDPYHGWDFWPGWPPANLHFWGILFAAGLLSLGAPFWYNALRNLSSLRPLLAGKQEKEQEQRSA